MITYPVHERFLTFQGEGVHSGRPAFFIRLFGCPVQCPWCDSAGTWHKDWVPKEVQRLNAATLAAELLGNEFIDAVVITGGEPAIHDLSELVVALNRVGYPVHLETSGAFKILGEMDWVTLSPKKWRPPISESVEKASEFKIIVEEPDDIPLYHEMLEDRGSIGHRPVWLHPEWSQRENGDVLKAIAQAVQTGRGVFRAGWQLHKLYGVDFLDNRTKPPVPLGGDPSKGY